MKEFRPSKHIGYLLKAVQHDLRNKMDQELRKIELTTPQYATISELDEYAGLTNADLARKCFVTPQTMNLIVRGLEKRGSILSSCENHGRKQDTNLSEKGIRTLKKAHLLVSTVESDLLSVLSDDEKRALEALLSKLNEGS